MNEFLKLSRSGEGEDLKNEYFYLRKESVYGILFNYERQRTELTIKNITKCWFTTTTIEEILNQMGEN